MSDRTWTRRIALTAAAGGFALALAAAPFAPNGDFPGFAPNAALAKGGGDNGANNSGGRGGGNGQGHGKGGSAPGRLISDSAGDGEDGPGHGHGLALGHDKDAVSGVQGGGSILHPENHGPISSMLGRLNAAHASPNAMEHAAAFSTVGRLATYIDLLEEGEIVAAAAELLAVANKDVANIDSIESVESTEAATVVREVNSLLGVTVGSTGEATASSGEATISQVDEEELIRVFAGGEVGGGLGSTSEE